jgi:hypothetical protein
VETAWEDKKKKIEEENALWITSLHKEKSCYKRGKCVRA